MVDEGRMEFWSTMVGLVRRKQVIIPALLVAATLGFLAYAGTPNTYVSSTTMVLTTTEYGGTQSQDPADPTQLSNPLLNFNDSLRTTGGILVSAMGTKEVQAQLGVGPPTVLIVNDGRTNPELLGLNGPFLYILVESTSAAEATRIVAAAQQLMRDKLRDWQRSLGAPEKTFVSMVDIVPPSTPQVDRGHATKLGGMAFIFGLLLSLGIAYFGHQVRARRRGRAAARAAAAGRRPSPPSAAVPDRVADETDFDRRFGENFDEDFDEDFGVSADEDDLEDDPKLVTAGSARTTSLPAATRHTSVPSVPVKKVRPGSAAPRKARSGKP